MGIVHSNILKYSLIVKSIIVNLKYEVLSNDDINIYNMQYNTLSNTASDVVLNLLSLDDELIMLNYYTLMYDSYSATSTTLTNNLLGD